MADAEGRSGSCCLIKTGCPGGAPTEERTVIKTETIDDTIREMARLMRALKALKAKHKELTKDFDGRPYRESLVGQQQAAAKRASMDLTRKLADLRAGR